ncbi:MAG TPA: TIGR03618 family F420-dependent PPOX class oxidoreductase [Mycobacteriales bacterium]
MPNRRPEIVMTDAEVREFLANGRVAVLATSGPDGVPDPLPMWYVVADGGELLMRTFAKSQKAVNLRRDPRAAVLVEGGEAYADMRGVQLTGRVETFDGVEELLDLGAALAVKYLGVRPEDVPAGREAARARGVAGFVGLRFVPERVVSWDHAKLGGRY